MKLPGHIKTDGNFTEAISDRVKFEIQKPKDPVLHIKTKIISINEKPISNENEQEESIKPAVSYQDKFIAEISVVNEGEGSGYAKKITMKLPEGIELDKENVLNEENGWKEVEEGIIETTKLSFENDINNELFAEEKSNEDENKDNITDENEKQKENLDKNTKNSLKIALRVSYTSKQNKDFTVETEVVQQNKRGDIISYIEENEQYSKSNIEMSLNFIDFNIEKKITKIIEKNTATKAQKEYSINQKQKEIIKMDLPAKKIDHTELTVIYQIKVTNEGNQAGKVEKIVDILPKGVTFEVSDNPGWKIDNNGNAIYEELTDDISPNETKNIPIQVQWKATSNNLSARTNYAIIESEMELDYKLIQEGKIDIDKTNNYAKSEMLLSVNTGTTIMLWTILTIISIAILITGIILIKKYVIKN